jgi:hypothetical protein
MTDDSVPLPPNDDPPRSFEEEILWLHGFFREGVLTEAEYTRMIEEVLEERQSRAP